MQFSMFSPTERYPYLEGLSPEQTAAVLHDSSKPSIILAGAGSGKTHTLAYKIKHLIVSGVSPRDILAVTFSSRAAEELTERIVNKHRLYGVTIGTFHSVGRRLLNEFRDRTPYEQRFSLIKDWKIKQFFLDFLKQQELEENFDWSILKARVSSAKKNLVSPAEYEEWAKENDLRADADIVTAAYTAYEDAKFRNNEIDFDDMIFWPARLLQTDQYVMNTCRNRYAYGLVDEAQDNNWAQFFIALGTCRHEGLAIIGDDFQSIYMFQGARPDLTIFDFYDKKNPSMYLLNDNYRSGSAIVQVANRLTEFMDNRFGKQMSPKLTHTGAVRLIACGGEEDQSSQIAMDVEMHNSLTASGWDAYAVLYRVNSQSRALEEAFMYREIPYVVIGGTSFFNRKEVKDIMAYFRLSVDPNKFHGDVVRTLNIASSRYVGRTRKIGKNFIDDLRKVNAENLWAAVNKVHGDARVNDFLDLVKNISRQPTTAAKISYIIDNCYSSYCREENGSIDEDGESNMSILDEIRQSFSLFVDDSKLISHVFKMQEYVPDKDDLKDKVKLMTVHKSKGLEWESVYVAGFNDRMFPHAKAEGPLAYAEERRIAYVAATRAKQRLSIYFITAQGTKRMVPSPFIAEMGLSADMALEAYQSEVDFAAEAVTGESLALGDG